MSIEELKGAFLKITHLLKIELLSKKYLNMKFDSEMINYFTKIVKRFSNKQNQKIIQTCQKYL